MSSQKEIASELDFRSACDLAKQNPGRIVVRSSFGHGFNVISSLREDATAALGKYGTVKDNNGNEFAQAGFDGRWVRVGLFRGRGLGLIDPERQLGPGTRIWFAYENIARNLYSFSAEAPRSPKQVGLALRGYEAYLDPRGVKRPPALDEEPFEVEKERIDQELREQAFDAQCRSDPRWSDDESIRDEEI